MTDRDGKIDLSRLSPRQREAAKLMGLGLSNKEIARRLDISCRTAEIHVGGVLKAIGTSRYRFIYAFAKWGYTDGQ